MICTCQFNCLNYVQQFRNITRSIYAKYHYKSCYYLYKLGCLPIDNIIRTRKLSLIHKIRNVCGLEHLSIYVNYVKNNHDYNTRTSRRNDLITPKCKENSGLRTFHSSATRLKNKTEPSLETRFHRSAF